jgi:ketosteroid isomerase-like protein
VDETIVASSHIEKGSDMWKLVNLAALAALAVALQVGGGGATASTGSTLNAKIQQEADLYEIDQIEVKFHRATSKHDINLMMSLWAPGAVFNIDQQTLTGKAEIRHWFLTENKAFMPSHHWESDTPSYKIKTNLNGDKATMYFECHYIDPKTGMVVAAAGVTHTLQKINGQWLIIDSAGSTATLSP